MEGAKPTKLIAQLQMENIFQKRKRPFWQAASFNTKSCNLSLFLPLCEALNCWLHKQVHFHNSSQCDIFV